MMQTELEKILKDLRSIKSGVVRLLLEFSPLYFLHIQGISDLIY